MKGNDAGGDQEKDTDVTSARNGAEIRDFQWKPNRKKLICGHNDKNPNVGVAENVDEEVEDSACDRIVSDKCGKINEIFG